MCENKRAAEYRGTEYIIRRQSAYGSSIALGSNDAALLEVVTSRVRHFKHPGHADMGDPESHLFVEVREPKARHRNYLLVSDGRAIGRFHDLKGLVRRLEDEVELSFAAHARTAVFLHAGAVLREDGEALLLPGASGAGKSTLVAALGRHGYRVVADEHAMLTRDGRLMVPEQGVPAARITAMMSLRYREGAHWAPVMMSPGEAVLATLTHAPQARTYPRRVLATLTAVMRGARGWQGDRADVGESVASVQALWKSR